MPQSRKAIVYIGVGVPIDTYNPRSEFDKTLRDEAIDVFRRADRANVNISAVDPAGLGGLAAYFQGHKDVRPNPSLHTDFLMSLADNTGGRAVVDTNGYQVGIARIVRENGSVLPARLRAGRRDEPAAAPHRGHHERGRRHRASAPQLHPRQAGADQ